MAPGLWAEDRAGGDPLFKRGRDIAAGHGLIWSTQKYEFGVDADG